MADPLSIAGSIAGLVSIADVVFSRTYRYAKAVTDAKRDVLALADEIRSLSGILHNLSLIAAELEDEPTESTLRLDHINSCRQVLLKIQRKLEKSDLDKPGDQKSGSMFKRMKWPFSESETKDILAQLARHQKTISMALSADSMAKLHRALSNQERIISGQRGLQDAMTEMNRKLERRTTLETRVELNDKRRGILEFFQRVDPGTNHSTSMHLRHPLTGLWLTEHETFKAWLNTNRSRLWLSGIPGAGKTVLASAVIEESVKRSSPIYAVAFFYCDYKDERRQDALNIFGSLAVQLAKQDESQRCFQLLEDYYQECHPKDKPVRSPEVARLVNLVQEMSQNFDEVSILVDALDECGNRRCDLIENLVSLNADMFSNISSLFLSRDEQDIRFFLEDTFSHIPIAAHSDDLRLYVAAEMESRIRRRTLRIKNQELKREIMERFIHGAEGMFRWVSCQIDYLCDLPNDKERREALDHLPPDLNSTYERILERAHKKNQSVRLLVQNTLRWVIHSKSPLSISELCEALAIETSATRLDPELQPDEDEILRQCGSLVRRSVAGQRIELAHFTVKEFFQTIKPQQGNFLAEYHMEPTNSARILAHACLSYLNFADFSGPLSANDEDLEERQTKHPFRVHAVKYWYKYAEGHCDDSSLLELAKCLFKPSKTSTFLNWAQEYCLEIRYEYVDMQDQDSFQDFTSSATSHGTTPLHFAAILGILPLCDWLVRNGCKTNQISRLGSPLQSALLQNIAIDALVSSIMEDYWEEHYHVDDDQLLRLLAKDCGDLNRPFYDAGGTSRSTFELAIRTKFYGEAFLGFAEFLLESGAVLDKACLAWLHEEFEFNPWNEDRVSRLESFIGIVGEGSVEHSAKSKFQALKEAVKDAMESFTHERSLESLEFAVKTDNIEELQERLNAGRFDIDATDYDDETGSTLLHLAASARSLSVMELLLTHGATIDQKDDQGRTPLHISASVETMDGVTHFLLEHGANADETDHDGRTVWHFAAEANNTEVLNALIRSEREAQKKLLKISERGFTPITEAAKAGANNALLLMLEIARMDTGSSSDGLTLAHYAANLPLDIFEVVMGYDIELTATSRDGSTPLDHLVKSSTSKHLKEKVELLLRSANRLGTSGEVTTSGSTVIHACCSKESKVDAEILAMLLCAGFDPDIQAPSVLDTPLVLAAAAGKIEHTRVLLNHGADFRKTDAKGWGPIHHAAANGYIEVLKALVDRNPAPIDWISRVDRFFNDQPVHRRVYGCTVLHLSAQYSGHLQYFLEEGLWHDLNLQALNGDSVLHLAAYTGNVQCIDLILSHDGEIDVQNTEGETPLHLAALNGYIHVVHHLVLKGANVNSRTSRKCLPLHYAAAHGRQPSVLRLLEFGSCLDRNSDGKTPERCAREWGHHKIADILQKEQNDNNVMYDALIAALEHRDVDFCKVLTTSGGNMIRRHHNCNGCPPVLVALEISQPRIAAALVRNGFSVEGEICATGLHPGHTAAHLALLQQPEEGLLSLILSHSKSNMHRDCPVHPLHCAVALFHNSGLVTMLDHYYDGSRDLQGVISTINVAMQLAQAEFGINPTTIHTPLNPGASIINIPIRADQLEYDWSLSPLVLASDVGSATPLHVAAWTDNFEAAEILLSYGADPNSLTCLYDTPLHYAVRRASDSLARVLLGRGANVNAQDFSGSSPALEAAQRGNLSLLKEFAKHNADFSLQNTANETFLHLSSESNAETLAYVLSKGLVGTEDVYGRSPLFRALSNWSAGIPSLILNTELSITDAESMQKMGLNHLIEHQQVSLLRKMLRRMTREHPAIRAINNPSPQGQASSLCLAAVTGNGEVMKLLIDFGALLESEGCDAGTPLMAACQAGRLPSVKFLIRQGSQVAYRRADCVVNGVSAGKSHPEVTRWLLVERYTDQRKICQTPPTLQETPLTVRSGPIQAKVPLEGKYARSYGESMFEYLLRLHSIRRSFSGTELQLDSDGVFQHVIF